MVLSAGHTVHEPAFWRWLDCCPYLSIEPCAECDIGIMDFILGKWFVYEVSDLLLSLTVIICKLPCDLNTITNSWPFPRILLDLLTMFLIVFIYLFTYLFWDRVSQSPQSKLKLALYLWMTLNFWTSWLFNDRITNMYYFFCLFTTYLLFNTPNLCSCEGFHIIQRKKTFVCRGSKNQKTLVVVC